MERDRTGLSASLERVNGVIPEHNGYGKEAEKDTTGRRGSVSDVPKGQFGGDRLGNALADGIGDAVGHPGDGQGHKGSEVRNGHRTVNKRR